MQRPSVSAPLSDDSLIGIWRSRRTLFLCLLLLRPLAKCIKPPSKHSKGNVEDRQTDRSALAIVWPINLGQTSRTVHLTHVRKRVWKTTHSKFNQHIRSIRTADKKKLSKSTCFFAQMTGPETRLSNWVPRTTNRYKVLINRNRSIYGDSLGGWLGELTNSG